MKKILASIIFLAAVGVILPTGILAATLNVELTATPSSGVAPLNGVDLTATVSGTATGNIIYKFDCLNDGSWERQETTANTTYTAIDLCNYSNPGSYSAKVSVERGGLVFDGTMAILVQANPNLSVTLSASPSSGQAPLNGVDLTAQVSGSATGDIVYKFDCASDNVWDRVTTTSSAIYTVFDLCNYQNPGTYIATVQTERGGLSFQGTTAVVAASQQQSQTLYASLEALPNTGNAPLNGVDLRATVTGTATGTINYRFDCASDGTWDYTFNGLSDNPKTVVDACNYQNAGTYLAKVRAERGTANPAEATAQVVVGSVSGTQNLSISKLARNLSDGTGFQEVMAADPGEVIEFRIFITSTGSQSADNLIVKDTLPDKINYKGNLKIDNVLVSGDILTGLNIGALNPQQTKTVIFEAVVANSTNFAFGSTDLINTALVYNTAVARTSTAKVRVVKTEVLGATTIPTGIFSSAQFAFLLALLTTLLLTYFMLLKFYLGNRAHVWGFSGALETARNKVEKLLPRDSDKMAKEKLAKMIQEIKERERN